MTTKLANIFKIVELVRKIIFTTCPSPLPPTPIIMSRINLQLKVASWLLTISLYTQNILRLISSPTKVKTFTKLMVKLVKY